MTNGVNFNGYGYGYYPQYAQYQQAAEYATARVVEEKTDSTLSGVGVFAALNGITETAKAVKAKKAPVKKASTGNAKGLDKFLNLFKKETYVAKGESLKETGKILKDMGNEYVASVKTSVKSGMETIKNTPAKDVIKNTVQKGVSSTRIQSAKAAIPDSKKIAKLSEEAKTHYSNANKYINYAKKAKTTKTTAANLAKAEKCIAEANAASAKTVVGKTIGKIATKSPILAKAGTVFKASGTGVMAIFEGFIEVCTEVAPTFAKLGAKKGFKQLGKSTLKVGASAGGWAGGWAIGAAIGSVIPGAGTAVGAIVGGLVSVVGGMIGSSLARKGVEKIVGKNELEIATEKEQQQVTLQQQQQAALQQQQMIALQQQQQALSQISYSSNPFNKGTNFMDKDIMGVMSGYVF